MAYNKYSNRKTFVDGICFDSKAEAWRYMTLKVMENAGEIDSLKLQPRFTLQDSFKIGKKTYRKIEYVADFMYRNLKTGEMVVEDVKGVETDVFKLKKKLFLKQYGNKYNFITVK